MFPTSWTISDEWRWQLLPTGIPFPLQPCHGGHRWSKKRCQVLSWKICVVVTLKLPGEGGCAGLPIGRYRYRTPLDFRLLPRESSPHRLASGSVRGPSEPCGSPKSPHQPLSLCRLGTERKSGVVRSAVQGIFQSREMGLGRGKRAGYQWQPVSNGTEIYQRQGNYGNYYYTGHLKAD